MLSPTSLDCFLAFVRPFNAEDKAIRLFNAHRPSWLGNAMEPVLNSGLRAFPISRAEAACDSMSTDTHPLQQLRRTTDLALNGQPPTLRLSKSGAPKRRRLDRPPTVSLSSTRFGVERQINRCRRPVLRTSFSAITLGTNKTNSEAPYLLGTVGNPLRIDCYGIPQTRLILPPNAPMSGAGVRSTKASAPLAG